MVNPLDEVIKKRFSRIYFWKSCKPSSNRFVLSNNGSKVYTLLPIRRLGHEQMNNFTKSSVLKSADTF